MENIVAMLESMPAYIGSNGRSNEEIDLAEKKLECTFAQDYHEYLSEVGLACFDGHELTGLTKTERLNVVTVTTEQRKLLGDMVSTWYVVEETNIDGIVVWQDSVGTVYETALSAQARKVASSLLEYYAQKKT